MSTVKQNPVGGCRSCPLRGAENEEPKCNLSADVTIPLDSECETIDAVPRNCPLWDGAIQVALERGGA